MTKVCYWNHLGGEAPIWIAKITVQFVDFETEVEGERDSLLLFNTEFNSWDYCFSIETRRSKWSICNFSIEILEICNEEYLV